MCGPWSQDLWGSDPNPCHLLSVTLASYLTAWHVSFPIFEMMITTVIFLKDC